MKTENENLQNALDELLKLKPVCVDSGMFASFARLPGVCASELSARRSGPLLLDSSPLWNKQPRGCSPVALKFWRGHIRSLRRLPDLRCRGPGRSARPGVSRRLRSLFESCLFCTPPLPKLSFVRCSKLPEFRRRIFLILNSRRRLCERSIR